MTQLGIMIKTLYDGKGTKAATKDLKGLETQTGKSSSKMDMMKSVMSKLAVGAAAAGAAVVVAKKAFDFSKEGAQLLQLEESFDLMNKEVFKTPGLLDDMRDAAKGTVKDTDLMKGLLTLTAGATREVSTAMAAASPQLIKIAKAANKLNPLLGDTGFLYDSLALGIKRASPMILDNLGLTIKVGDANEKYAEKIGKNVKELSAQEKQLALLEAALESGDKLIDQVGGNVDSMADSWDRATVMVGNHMDELKKGVAQAIIPALESAEKRAKATATMNQALRLGIITNKEYKKQVKELQKEGLNWSEALISVAASLEDQIAVIEEDIAVVGSLRANMEILKKTFRGTSVQIEAASADLKFFARVSDVVADAIDDLTQEGEEWLEVSEDIIKSVLEQNEAALAVIDTENDMAIAIRNAKEELEENKRETDLVVDSYGNFILKSEAVTVSVDALGNALVLSEADARGFRSEVNRVVSSLGYMQDESEPTATALGAAFLEIYRAGKKAADEIERAHRALDALDGSDAKITITTQYDQIGQPGQIPGENPQNPPLSIPPPPPQPGDEQDRPSDVPTPPPSGDWVPFQHGANFTVPPGYPNDSFPMRVTSGEHVQVTPRGRGRGGNILVQQFFTIRGGGNPYYIAQEAANQAATVLGDKMRG